MIPAVLLALTICIGLAFVVKTVRFVKSRIHGEQPSELENVEIANSVAADLLKDGHGASEIEAKLIDMEIDESTAANLTRSSITSLSQEEKSKGIRNMRLGAAICASGGVVTAVTYWAADPGETYIIAWGAIAFGATAFLKGHAQWRRGGFWSTK